MLTPSQTSAWSDGMPKPGNGWQSWFANKSRKGCAPDGVPVFPRRSAPGANVQSLPDAHRQTKPPGICRNAGRRGWLRLLLLDQRLPISSLQVRPQALDRLPSEAEKARSARRSLTASAGGRESQLNEKVAAMFSRKAPQARQDIRDEGLPGNAPLYEVSPDQCFAIGKRPPCSFARRDNFARRQVYAVAGKASAGAPV